MRLTAVQEFDAENNAKRRPPILVTLRDMPVTRRGERISGTWWLFSTGALRDKSPEGALIDASTTTNYYGLKTHLMLVALYFGTLAQKARKEFERLKNSLAIDLKRAKEDPGYQPRRSDIDELRVLKDKAKAAEAIWREKQAKVDELEASETAQTPSLDDDDLENAEELREMEKELAGIHLGDDQPAEEPPKPKRKRIRKPANAQPKPAKETPCPTT